MTAMRFCSPGECRSDTSVRQLVQRIDHFVSAYNTNGQPFKWTAAADSILEKLHRRCSRIGGTGARGQDFIETAPCLDSIAGTAGSGALNDRTAGTT
jgi:hypothetical protein